MNYFIRKLVILFLNMFVSLYPLSLLCCAWILQDKNYYFIII